MENDLTANQQQNYFRLFAVNLFSLLLVTGVIIGFRNPVWAGSHHANQSPPSSSFNQLSVDLPSFEITVDEILYSGFTQPVQVTHAGDGSQRLFVIEQPGLIKIIQKSGVLPDPFLDIRENISSGGERGLLGLAFHPDFASNGHFYINYTRTGDGATVVARYTASANPNLADPNSGATLLTISQPYSNHNGGQLAFGPDGYLYIGMGDGGSGGDPQNYAQNIDSLLGKMLRLDIDHGSPYTIPPDNPFLDSPGADEIWALGLRNPWRFSFDRDTGDLYIGDVGQNLWEEINYTRAGSPGGNNFGWRCKEGTYTFNTDPPCDDPAFLATLTDPIAEYNHSEGQSVTGGFVYRGNQYPSMQGWYFYADYVQGKIWSTTQTDLGVWSQPVLLQDESFRISCFGEDEASELYLCDYTGGTIRRVADARGPSPDLSSSTKSVSPISADPGETITFTIRLTNTAGLSDSTVFLTDTIPTGLNYVQNTLHATSGKINDSDPSRLYWQGIFSPTRSSQITYQATVQTAWIGSLINQAQVSGEAVALITLQSALLVPRGVLTTTHNDFFLPGTQPNTISDTILSPGTCDVCHTEPIYDRWRGSMMSQAGRDPLMWAALTIANNDAPNSGETCLRCHTTKGWLEGRSHPSDGSTLQPADLEAGVTCEICHRMVDPVPSPNDQARETDQNIRTALTTTMPTDNNGGAMIIIDPSDNRRGPFSLGIDFQFHPENTYQTDILGRIQNDYVTRSRLCGTCHNVNNPVLSWDTNRGQFWPNENDQPAPSFDKGQLFPIETTFDEWFNSQYAVTGVFAPQFAGQKPDGIVGSCQDCHLPRATGLAAEEFYNPIFRDCENTGCLPVHEMIGGNSWVPQLLLDDRWRLNSLNDAENLYATTLFARQMLRKSATITTTLISAVDGGKLATVRVVNQTGHKLPTGYPEGRRLWLNLKAYDARGDLIYESGAYNPTSGTLTKDNDIKVYEAKQGLTPELAALVGWPAGESFHFVLNNTVIKDNRIPPRGYTQKAFDRPGLRPIGATYSDGQYWDDTVYMLPDDTESIQVTLFYQTASKEYVDFLRTYGGLDGDTIGSLWDSSKSPPEVIATALYPSVPLFLPIIHAQSNSPLK
ncbi:MAG: PQQ-dependent sugar dehydrogenase [Anaerolineales bacterium]|nr:PQQ-dependent sugar dehydrogenase [Anaerolineales bacterium]